VKHETSQLRDALRRQAAATAGLLRIEHQQRAGA
jgi:hypothetical protein